MPAHSDFGETYPNPECSENADISAPRQMPSWAIKDDIVISGISGRFPDSDNVQEFWENLINGVDMVRETEQRWSKGTYNLPALNGFLKDYEKFDANFFGVSAKQAQHMTSEFRIFIETMYECIIDAGYDPADLRGKKIGVYAGLCSNDSEGWGINDHFLATGYSLLGSASAMLANRASFCFDFRGPSITINAACASGSQALDTAIREIRSNKCEAAIVSGVNICLEPELSAFFNGRRVLSPDGSCRVFDAKANGYARSDAVGCLFVQKSKDARRIYATVVHSKAVHGGQRTEDDNYPNAHVQKALFKELYEEARVNPSQVSYIEAHAVGLSSDDQEEVKAVASVFCQDRGEPLLMGSVKSNMGFSEGSSGIVGIIKVLLSMEHGVIPANLHYNTPDPCMTAITQGLIQVPTKPVPWKGTLAAVNSFGRGGTNTHVLLRANKKERGSHQHSSRNIPRLLKFSTRTKEGIQEVLEQLDASEISDAGVFLLDHVSNLDTSSFNYRGYVVKQNSTTVVKEIAKTPHDPGKVWYVFTGMGSQCSKICKPLMQLEVFAKTIVSLTEVLKPYGIDLIHLLTEADEAELISTINSFICIAAVQVALVNVLRTLGITAVGYIGHSLGEVGCAYADGCITAEQAMIIAYWRGRCIDEAGLPKGAMAAIGLTLKEVEHRLPKGLSAACHNSHDSVTVSGKEEDVLQFVQQLKSEGIFARHVNTCGVPFHSPYMQAAGPLLKDALDKLIPDAKPRTSCWISSSVLKSNWKEDWARFASADYFVNNLLSPVLFEEALHCIPPDAVVIEIAPHCLLQAILKRSLPGSCKFVGLTKKTHPNSLEYLMMSLGKLFNFGINIHVSKLYPEIQHPVPKGTLGLSSLVKWDHIQSWKVPDWSPRRKRMQNEDKNILSAQNSENTPFISLAEYEDAYLAGHCIDGRILFPAMGYLVLAWKALAKLRCQLFHRMPVAFEDCKFHRATILSQKGSVSMRVRVHPVHGKFEISEGGSVACSGRIYVPTKEQLRIMTVDDLPIERDETTLCLEGEDIYKEFRLRGYEYVGAFQSLAQADFQGTQGTLKWNGNYITYLDGLMQLEVLDSPKRNLVIPTYVRSLIIDVHKLNSEFDEFFARMMPVAFDKHVNVCVTTGVEMKGLKASAIERRKEHNTLVLEKYHFVPYFQENILEPRQEKQLEDYVTACSALARKIIDSFEVDVPLDVHMNDLRNVSTDTIVIFQEKGQDNFVLFETLTQILSSKEHVLRLSETYSQANSYYMNSEFDLLNREMVSEQFLRVPLDIILENMESRKLKMVEVYVKSSLRRDFSELLSKSASLIKPQYILAYENGVDVEELLQAGEMKGIQWNPKDDLPADLKNSDLVIAKEPFESEDGMEIFFFNADGMVKDNGFLLIVTRTWFSPAEILMHNLHKKKRPTMITAEDITNQAEAKGFVIVCERKDRFGTSVLLYRKAFSKPVLDNFIIEVTEGDYQWVEKLKKSLIECQQKAEACNIWLVARDSVTNGIIGLVNCLRMEPGGKRIRCIFERSTHKDHHLPYPVDFEVQPYNTLLKRDLVMNVSQDGVFGCFRHTSIPEEPPSIPEENAHLNVSVKGDLSSFRWYTTDIHQWPKDAIIADTYYSALNFKDVMLASGKLPADVLPEVYRFEECLLGFEISGRNRKTGKRIMGMTPHKGFATTVSVDEYLSWDVPDHWTLEDAATVPVVYSTAYYALVIRGKIKPGSSLLVHSGSGGVGQAAISIALSLGCEIFVTVGTEAKRKYLRQLYPQLKEENFSSSRDTSFELNVMERTNGRGVDIVLNSLAEDKLQASVRCLAEYGTFLEIGKYDLAENNILGLANFEKNIIFHGILVDGLFDGSQHAKEAKIRINELVNEGIKSGVVKPLTRTVFSKDQIEEAFRFMANGKHKGKVVFQFREEEEGRFVRAPRIQLPALSRSLCHPMKSYVITGGLGGFGLQLADWLIGRGARNIVLSSRSGVRSGYQHWCLKKWSDKGIRVIVSKKNICKLDEAEELLRQSEELGSVDGIFHLAMVLQDAFMENQTAETFEQVSQPKVLGTHNLDHVSRKICPAMKWFVVFSSMASGVGNMGQSNYAFANSVMERICEKRQREGFSALAIQWGAIGDVGVLYRTMGGNDVVLGCTVPQRIHSCMAVLDRFLQEDAVVLSSYMKDTGSERNSSKKQNLTEIVARIMGINDLSTISREATLGNLGLDSLMAVEIKQAFEYNHELVLPMQEIRNLTFENLFEIQGRSVSVGKEKSEDSVTSDRKSEAQGSMSPISLPVLVMPCQVWIPMNNKTGSNPLFFIHAIEGHVQELMEVAAMLPFPVVGIQYVKEANCNKSIQELSKYYLNVIKSLCPCGPYNIAGYSYGCSVAFEMAILLQENSNDEQDPPVSNLIMMDGSPLFISMETKEQEKHIQIRSTSAYEARTIGESKALCTFLNIHGITLNFLQLTEELSKLPDLEERQNHVVDKVLTPLSSATTKDTLLDVTKSFVNRFLMAHEYVPMKTFTGNVTLLKAQTSIQYFKNMPFDFGLNKVIDGNVTVVEIPGDHLTFIHGSNAKTVADIVANLVSRNNKISLQK